MVGRTLLRRPDLRAAERRNPLRFANIKAARTRVSVWSARALAPLFPPPWLCLLATISNGYDTYTSILIKLSYDLLFVTDSKGLLPWEKVKCEEDNPGNQYSTKHERYKRRLADLIYY
jgi:hypothetical protein